MNNDFWIEVDDNISSDKTLLKFNTVISISLIDDKKELWFQCENGKEYVKTCMSDIEAQMIYAKLKKKLCTDEELNEIL